MAETALAQPVAVHIPPRSWRGDARAIKIVWQRELIRFSQDRLRILTALVQPLLFLFVLGTGLSSASACRRAACGATCARCASSGCAS